MKSHPLKEIKDLWKFMKTQVKQATKRSNQFLKQLEKKEKKEDKRLNLLKQFQDASNTMNDELRQTRRFAERQAIFDPRYMTRSKLGDNDTAVSSRALILVELSDNILRFCEEVKDEVKKLLEKTIAEGTETFNIWLFSPTAIAKWCPQYQPKDDPKKGLADSIKWLNKNFTPKVAGANPFPPNWLNIVEQLSVDRSNAPLRIYMCCSRPPPDAAGPVALEAFEAFRSGSQPPDENGEEQPKLRPINVPLNIVAFDADIDNDQEAANWFTQLHGPDGTFLLDTTQQDCLALDKLLKSVALRKKQLDKLTKKLDKLEDLSEKVIEDRRLLRTQISLQRFLEADFEMIVWAMNNEVQSAPILNI